MSTPVNDEALTLLPDNATAFEACHSAVDQRLLDLDTNIIRTEREPASCTAAFLPFLAWERSVHHWTGTDPVVDAARVASSFTDHAGYGSPAALEAEITLDVGTPVTVREWFEVPGFAWPDFQVVVPIVPGVFLPTDDVVAASAIRRKNVRDWPSILFEVTQTGPLGIGCATAMNATINLLPLDPTPHDYGAAYYGAALSIAATLHLEPF